MLGLLQSSSLLLLFLLPVLRFHHRFETAKDIIIIICSCECQTAQLFHDASVDVFLSFRGNNAIGIVIRGCESIGSRLLGSTPKNFLFSLSSQVLLVFSELRRFVIGCAIRLHHPVFFEVLLCELVSADLHRFEFFSLPPVHLERAHKRDMNAEVAMD